MDALLAAVRELLGEQRATRQAAERCAEALEAMAARPGAEAGASRLLSAISAALGSEPFSCGALLRLAQSELSTRIALRSALDGMTAKSLGKALAAACEAGAIDGLRVERAGRRLWRVAFETSETRGAFNPWR